MTLIWMTDALLVAQFWTPPKSQEWLALVALRALVYFPLAGAILESCMTLARMRSAIEVLQLVLKQLIFTFVIWMPLSWINNEELFLPLSLMAFPLGLASITSVIIQHISLLRSRR